MQIFRLECTAGEFAEALTESVKIFGFDAQSRRHGVTAVTREQIVAFTQGRGQVKTRDAAAGTAPFLALAAQDDRGPIKFLEHARCNDADDADVPEQLAFDDLKVRVGIELRAHRADDLLDDAALDFLHRSEEHTSELQSP